MPDRQSFYVLSHENSWAVRLNDGIIGRFGSQQDAAQAAKRIARDKQPSQVLVQGRDGKWQEESTYGDAPYPPAN